MAHGERSVPMRGRKGSDTMTKKRTKQNYHNYTLRKGRLVVKHGITDDPERRLDEMKNEGLQFTSMTLDTIAVSEETARKREEERIKAYQKSHGKKPKYNKI